MFFRLGTGEGLQRVFVAAGFRKVAVKRLETRLLYANGDEACEAAFAGGPVGLAYSRFWDTTKAEAHNAYLNSLEQLPRWRRVLRFVVVVGTK